VNTGSDDTGVGIFCYNTCTFTGSRNTIFYPTQGGIAQPGYAMGDGGMLAAQTPLVQNSIVQAAGIGISDQAANVWSTAGTGGVGASNNDVFGAATAYATLGTSTNFGTSHPNAAYGDRTINPALIAPGRRYATADAYLGGPGTELHLFQQLTATQTPLVAVLGIAGGLSANAAYTPQAVYAFLEAGFAPMNTALAQAASDGSYLGAAPPILIGAWMQ